jgi:hypothetical protein
MKRFLVLTVIMVVCASMAFAQTPYIYENDNEIGIYTDPNPTADNAEALATYSGAPGQIAAYVVLTHPINMDFGAPNSGVRNPIAVVGGFEFRLNMPANVFLLTSTMPPQSTNFATPPEWLAGCNAPVVDDHVTLLTLGLGEFSGTPSLIYLSPVQDAPQSIPGSMAITDYNDDFRLNPAYPVSGDYAAPVFGLWTGTQVVPTDDAAWGDVKSLYR